MPFSVVGLLFFRVSGIYVLMNRSQSVPFRLLKTLRLSKDQHREHVPRKCLLRQLKEVEKEREKSPRSLRSCRFWIHILVNYLFVTISLLGILTPKTGLSSGWRTTHQFLTAYVITINVELYIVVLAVSS